MSLLLSVTSAEQRAGLKCQPDDHVYSFQKKWSRASSRGSHAALSPSLQVNFELDKCLNWLFSADFLACMALNKKEKRCLNLRAGKIWPTTKISAQQQQPMFRACCPVPVLGGVIRPSAPRWHERFMFILDQSVCLFRKGFDHSTPWPPGSNCPPAAVIRFTLSPGQFGNMLCFCAPLSFLNCSSDSFFHLLLLSRSPCLELRPTVESFRCLMMVWVSG